MTARCIMVLGTTSGAGKSWLATALCRYYARQGLKVAPFKAQNMSNNARVVAGGEIGSAQYFQALAACAAPEVRMNPLLLKPEADTHSQVVLLGQVSAELTAMPWRGRSLKVWPQIAAALDALRAENDVVVIEGAGSPAEINLHASDVVNMRVARHCKAACLLVTDIDRGGAFAHLYGTWALLPEGERTLIHGFVLNKFRGDATLLAPAPQMLQERTGVPTVAVLPMWWQHGLPEEDGVFDDRSVASGAVQRTVAVLAYPRISNLDEFQPLKNVPGVRLLWAHSPQQLAGLGADDWVVLPGSKATAADLVWLRAQGLDAAVQAHAARGGVVLGICGGLQMLGQTLEDPHGIDGAAQGLGLLPLVTEFARDKTVQSTHTGFVAEWPVAALAECPQPTSLQAQPLGAGAQASCCQTRRNRPAPPPPAAEPACSGAGSSNGEPWAALAGVPVQGYEIHHGQTRAVAGPGAQALPVLPGGLGWCSANGRILGLYLHGLLEDPAVLQALFGAAVPTLDSVFERMADYVGQHFEAGVLDGLGRLPGQPGG
ncbi:MAG: cobyric acid synthase [Rhodoferax sp.]